MISAEDYTIDEVYNSAKAKGKLAADYWVGRYQGPSSTDYYADICSYYGACIFGDAQEDSSYYKKINGDYNRNKAILTDNIDHCSCGILPLHLYIHNQNEQQLKLGIDAVKANIQKDGFVRNAIDDTYMTGSLHIQAYLATEDTTYLNFFADYMTMYQKNLQQKNGLYWHHKDLSHQYWGRGNGWGAASAAELLRVLPEDHPKYVEFVDMYKKHMQGLVDAQLDNGMWPQLLLDTSNRNWEETSGTSMFVFALFTGLELGILDKSIFLEPAKNGWMAVAEYLGSDGKLKNIAGGFWPKVGDANEYLSAQKAESGNSHGTAGFIWAATGVIRYHNMLTAVNRDIPHIIHSDVPSSDYHLKMKVFDLRGRACTLARQHLSAPVTNGLYIKRTNKGVSRSLTVSP